MGKLSVKDGDRRAGHVDVSVLGPPDGQLSPGQLPPGGLSYSDAAVQDYDGVAVTAWLKDVWMRPVCGLMSWGSASM